MEEQIKNKFHNQTYAYREQDGTHNNVINTSLEVIEFQIDMSSPSSSLSSGGDLQSRLKAAKDRLVSLTQQVTEIKKQKLNGSLAKSAEKTEIRLTKVRPLECLRTFTGHNDNVTSIQWSGLESTFVSAGKDGQVIIWNGITRRQVQVIKHSTQWLMTCAYETRNNRLIATGGADRVCSVFVVGQIGMTHPVAELKGHDGYLSSARFIDDNNIITSSGDSSAVLWDISRVQSKQSFTEHAADCLTVSLHPTSQSFATGSADCTVKIWDIRSGKCTHTFTGHESDVNGVSFFPDGMAIGTAGTDSTCRIFDLRSFGQVAAFELSDSQVPASSVCFSRSGRIMFVGYTDTAVKAWDTTSTTHAPPAFTLSEHTGNVTSLGLNSTGNALCTGSADRSIKIWG